MKNKTLQKTLIGLLLLAVFFSPRFGGFRAQDFLLVLSILVWVVFPKSRNELQYIFRDSRVAKLGRLILVFLILSLAMTIVHILFGNLMVNPSLLFLVKEMQYFVLFGFILLNYDQAKFMLRLYFIFMGIQVVWGLAQIASGKAFGYYGIGLLGEGGSSQSGLVYFVGFAIALGHLLNAILERDKSKRKSLYFLFLLTLMLCVMSTASRTAIVAMAMTLVIAVVIFLLNRPWYLLISLAVGLPTTGLAYWWLTSFSGRIVFVDRALERLSMFSRGSSVRFWKWRYDIQGIMDYAPGWLVGMGAAVHNVYRGTLTLGADSQYLRIVYEKGVVGLALWCTIIITLFMLLRRNREYLGPLYHSWVLVTFGMLVTGVTHEVFVVVKIAESFWTFTGICLGWAYLVRQGSDKEDQLALS